MPKAKKKKIILFFSIFFSTFFLFFFFQDFVRNFVYSLFNPLQKFIFKTGQKTASVILSFSRLSVLEKEREALEKENLKLKAEIAKLRELKKENEILKEALQLKEKNFQVLPAEILGKSVGEDSLILDKGKKDGVFVGQVAISPENCLVGRVSKVYSDFSIVTLISQKEFRFNGKIQEKKIEGLIEGRGNLNLFFTLLPKEKEINVGDTVISSFLGGIFPDSILIGEIEKVEKLDIKPYQEAKIKIAFSLSDLEFVFLIKNFKPWQKD